MVGIVLASHGDLAQGIKQTASMVFGDQPDVVSVSLQPSMGPDDLRAEIEKEVATLSDQEQVLFLVDLWGGTPFNQINGLLDGHPTWAAVTGMNLPMVITAYTLRMNPEATAHEIATGLIQESRDGVRVKPESLEPEAPKAVEAAPTHDGLHPRGNGSGRWPYQVRALPRGHPPASRPGGNHLDQADRPRPHHRGFRRRLS